ncbi:MAG TPA: hypothetical protein VN203_14870, partial [Candidatus Acidoferrum sp.]|nr:hypothetical protein [Candidatus Acidoferrum sp.]
MESGAAGEAPEPRWEGGYTGFMWFGAGMIGLALVLFTAGQAEAIVKCLVCHGKPTLSRTLPSGRVQSLFVDEKQLKDSVHAARTCTDCHSDITAIPHKGEIKRVNCVRCHFKGNPVGAPQTDIYVEYTRSVHGVAAA